MVFTSPEWCVDLPVAPPDSIPICDFILNETYGRHALDDSKPPYTCGLSGKEYSALQVKERVKNLAKALGKELGWTPNQGNEWDKVVGVYSLNTVDTLALAWAVHRLSGVVTPASSAYTLNELTYQLKTSGSKVLFTCIPLLPVALAAASKSGIPRNRVYLLALPKEATGGQEAPSEFKTVDQLIHEGKGLAQLEQLKWAQGQGARQTAFLCYSSGTSGLPKGVRISHRNVIANVLQIAAFEKPWRDTLNVPEAKFDYTDIALNLLPMSHIYSLVVVCHASSYRGDQTIVMPRFEMKTYLDAIQRFKINSLYLVPPIIILMAKNKNLIDSYDLSSVRSIYTGAAPLGAETADTIQKQQPKWIIRQGYGLTETCTVVSSTAFDDIWFGSSGCLLPSVKARIVSLDGEDITGYDQPGELLVKSPSVVLGYLNNDEANKSTFQDGWMRTGDEAMFRKSPKGTAHLWIVDRIKELIKVKGLQVAPAELEAHLLAHPAVADAAVIPVLDDAAGEVPKAFVVKSASVGLEENDRMVKREIQKHVEQHKSRHKWLQGGVEFIDEIPKSPSGKILRRMLRDQEREARRKRGAKI